MKLLHFGRFYRHEFGGIERHVALLMAGLKGHAAVDNVAANMDGGTQVIESDCGRTFAIAAHGLLAGIPVAPTLPYFVRRLCRRERYDLFHLHFPDPLSHLAAALVENAPKAVVTWHSDVIRQKGLLRAYTPFLKRFLRSASAIVAATPAHFATSTQIPRDIDPGRLHVIPYGIDPSRFELDAAGRVKAAALRDRYGKSGIVFAVGRHVYYKGFEYLIRAMPEVEATLLLGGNGPLRKRLEALVQELQLKDKVSFVGRIPEAELPAYYAACDVFCMPSVERSEAFGIVQLEAMAAGRPVVCCELGNGVNYVNQSGKTGLAVPPRESPALAQALNTLLNDRQSRQRMGAEGRKRVSTEFSLQKMVAAHLRLYREVLSH